MKDAPDIDPIYPGGFPALIEEMEARRIPFSFDEGEDLPPLDVDLISMTTRLVARPEPITGPVSSFRRKSLQIQEEFQGKPEICWLNGLLIANLRKRAQPPQTAPLFQRLWAEQGDTLLAHLDPRWLVSSMTTFGEYGTTETQRQVGQSLSVLMGMVKLYETERLYSRAAPDRPFTLDGKAAGPLPLDMDQYAITQGGLDVNLLAQLWLQAEPDPVIAPLAHHLLTALIDDPRTVFRRLRVMRVRLERRRVQKAAARASRRAAALSPAPANPTDTLRWGLVTTVRAPLRDIARWAAHHLELGAEVLHINLDDPQPGVAAFLAQHPRLHVVECSPDWWARRRVARMDAHQLRQAFNATRIYRQSDLHWLGHIDIDEYLLPQDPVAELLQSVPDTFPSTRLSPAEVLARDTDDEITHFKLTHRAGGQPKSVLAEIYPTFGPHLYGGFVSHHSGKVFARPGVPDVRLGIHALRKKGVNFGEKHRLSGLFLGHFHAPSWADFQRHFEFRRARGSYRRQSDQMGLSDILETLDGPDDLRLFFDEVCADTPALRDRLNAHKMLLDVRIDRDAAVARVFGELPRD